ncbi:site-specific integrase [Pseudomonas aeruginosa]|uniref:site-specific integrase n=1 Tax=Pseudomonas aeruginosa TaxID=287 RepID=UPI000F817F03|nr:site-specific integrase [Pseudomonas aeruginosa]RTR54482.1 site-specific integrase [Pseudomonas aeruginosa]
MIIKSPSPNLDFLLPKGATSRAPLPLIFNKDGSFNWILNSYITKFGGGPNSYGVKPTPGTVFSRARNIDRFNIFLESIQTTIFDVSDSTIEDFRDHILSGETANNDTIKSIIRQVLSLLEHIQNCHPKIKLFTIDKHKQNFQVHASECFNKRQPNSGRYLSHECIEILEKPIRPPITFISNSEIKAWHAAIIDFTDNEYIIDRWYCLSTLLEFCGSRISEVLEISASAIIEAYEKNEPIRNIPVHKGKSKGSFRTISIPRSELQEVYKFIKKTHKLFPASVAHDGIFVHDEHGSKLKRNTFNSYYRKVISASVHADALSGVSYHSFRHRYFTLLVARNIRSLSNKSHSNILQVAMGAALADSLHASLQTLAAYVHLSEDQEIQDILNSENSVSNSNARTIDLLKSLNTAYKDGSINEKSYIKEIEKLING